ncbi:MAG: hypothetical protein ACLSHR_11640 [Oscillospiraceae bacterium]
MCLKEKAQQNLAEIFFRLFYWKSLCWCLIGPAIACDAEGERWPGLIFSLLKDVGAETFAGSGRLIICTDAANPGPRRNADLGTGHLDRSWTVYCPAGWDFDGHGRRNQLLPAAGIYHG